MRILPSLLVSLHLLGVLFWVGGITFAYTVLRPATGPLEPPVRLALWRRVFAKFLPWVGAAIVAILVGGYGLVFAVYGGFKGLPLYVNIMQGTGLLMMLLYVHFIAAPYRRFRIAVDNAVWPEAARNLNQMRVIVGINVILGVFTLIVGATGKYW
jgi:uncharacterized membrane protein